MAETAGPMLLRAGLISPEQLAHAHILRRQHGGSLGSHLVRIGAIGEEQLADFYRHRLMVPRVGREAFASVAKSVAALVPVDMAAEFRVVPISLDREGNLTLAMADPSDTHAVDEVGFFTGHFVMRAVASESVIDWALREYYNIATGATPPPPAPVALTAPARPAPAPPAAAPPPGAVPEVVNETTASGVVLLTKPKRKSRRIVLPPAVQPTPSAPPAGTPEEPILLTPKTPAAASSGAVMQPVQFEDTAPNPLPPVLDEGAAAAEPPADALQRAIAALRCAADVDGVAAALLDYLTTVCGRAVFLTIRKNALRGHHARGAEVAMDALREFAVSLETPSLFRDVVAGRFPYRGAPGDSPPIQELARALPSPGGDVILVPIAVRHKVVGIIYGDRLTGEPSEAGMTRVALEAGIAYERLIADKKSAGDQQAAHGSRERG